MDVTTLCFSEQRCLLTWFSRHGGVGLMVGLDDLRVFSNLNDSMIVYT